ncbi:hypothetical protein ISF_02320 [Cordyceps fumosorosea ARSEF 2679]|uniref:Uncharacterized protein n=1 Tax=Cordyceps fumosorosea (strain ARSEF 2679) TaxID=1081104 RepID=A0A168BNI4_CORFA|nr:hypothetical protein ISF_02320 [Cordyceps fumosorosea ARSEF 2679]OAA70346.1 hypothetical protein ISF_02320 [Cordyceps fumosorosea ARSEF 2679]
MAKPRTNSDSGDASAPHSSRPSRLGSLSALVKIRRKGSVKEHPSSSHNKPITTHSEYDLADTHTLQQTDSASLYEPDCHGRELHSLCQRLRPSPITPSQIDHTYNEFIKVKDRGNSLCLSIMQEELKPLRGSPSAHEPLQRQDSYIESPLSPGQRDNRSSFSGRSLVDVVSANGVNRLGIHGAELWIGPIRDWHASVELLVDAFQTSLAETYKTYEKDASPDMIEALFDNKRFRRDAITRMRNASVTRVLAPDPQFFPRYEIRFRNFEKAKQELTVVRQILQTAQSAISPSREVREIIISERGDAVLEFANHHAGCSPNDPVLRFRVSSHMLAETSPIFAHMFSGHASSVQLHEAEDITAQLPPPRTKYYFDSGTAAWLYRMPQRETNHLESLSTLLHAAHMHNGEVPRDISFDKFVAIAECSIRYKSTSPLELMVEHRWLPQWMHRGADDMPDGLLLISYAFGSRGLFSRMSKSAIFHLVDEKDLQSKPWPQKIKDKIWAVRSTKIAQLHDCCTAALQEYTKPPTSEPAIAPEPEEPPPTIWGSLGNVAPQNPTLALTTTPRCPKGSHWCDATNLGWLMMLFNNMNMLSTVMQSKALTGESKVPFASKSLAQTVDLLRLLPSSPAPVHRGGVCDPIPAFRTAVADIYNSVSGLTLFDISQKSHGWALSKHAMLEPQSQVATGLGRMAAPHDDYTVANEFPETVLLQILSTVTDIADLHAAARVNRAFYETYKTYELLLMRNILRAGQIRRGSVTHPVPLTTNNAEAKMKKSESDQLKERMIDDRTDSAVVDSGDDDQTTDSDSDAESDEMPVAATPAERPEEPSGSTRMQAEDVVNSVLSSLQPSERADPPEADEDVRDLREAPMTEEEARRILWPDDVDEPTTTSTGANGAQDEIDRGLREKFLHGLVSECLEDKTLMLVNEKRLLHETAK